MESRRPTPQAALQPVNPNECALAVAIPLTRERFLADLALPAERDFVHHFRLGRGLQKASPEFCWEVYEDAEAVLAEAVCREVKRHRVTVCYDARLADLTDLLYRFPVVTLVAHWRFAPVEPEDILDAPRLLELLQSPQTDLGRAIRGAFEVLDSQLLQTETTSRLSDDKLRQRVAGVIRTTANEAERLYWDDKASSRFEPQQMPDGLRDRLTRWEFEQAFLDCIAPARAIELSDGMFTVPELIEAVPQDFSGLLDLTVCNSVIPANSIRHRRPNCLVAANRRPAELRSRMYLYGLEISILAKRPMPFIEVIKQVHTGQSVYKVKAKRWNAMESFRKVLRQYSSGSPVTAGARLGGGKSQPNDREALQKALSAISRRNEKYFVIGAVMASVLFVALIVAAFLQIGEPNGGLIKLASPLFGTSAAVIVWRMFKTWREKIYTDFVLALVANVDEETSKTIVEILVKKL